MARITLLCDHCAFVKPRSARLLSLLDSMRYELSLIHKGAPHPAPPHLSKRVNLLHFPVDKSSKERSAEENAAIARACEKGEFEVLIHTPNRAIIPHLLDSLPAQDLLIVEDITLLPFACAYKAKRGAKILIDLREYYPLEYEGDSAWMAGLGRFFAYLCEAYLPQVDCALSVSEGLCARYKAEYGIACELYYSLPPYFTPSALGLESGG